MNELKETQIELLRSSDYHGLDTVTLYVLRQSWTGEPINPHRSQSSRKEAQKVLSRICLELDAPDRDNDLYVLERADAIVNDAYSHFKVDNTSSES